VKKKAQCSSYITLEYVDAIIMIIIVLKLKSMSRAFAHGI
jgi:hypothetical protein